MSLLDQDVVAANLTAHGAHKLKVRLTNRTDEPLTVEFPPGLVADGFAQNPVLAQFPGGGGGGGGGSGGGGGGQGLGFLQTGDVNIAAGETTELTFRTACLNFGVPEPSSSSLLFLKRVEEYTPDPQVRLALTRLATRQVETPIAQAVLWHVADKMSWQQLSAPGSLGTPRQLTQARQWLAEQTRPTSSASVPAAVVVRAAPDPPLTLALNPDPRGSKESGPLVRQMARHLRQSQPQIPVTYRNHADRPANPDRVVMQWNALVKTRRSKDERQPGEPVLLTVQRSVWQPGRQRWQYEKPIGVALRGVPESAEPSTMGRWLAVQLVRELSSRSILLKWAGAGKTRLSVANQLPVALQSVTVEDKQNSQLPTTRVPIAVPAGGTITLALAVDQAHRLASARRLVASAFEVQPTVDSP